MHPSAMNLMRGFIENNLDKQKHYDLLDFGSFINEGQTLNHRQLLEGYDVNYVGVDIQAGRNVDIQMVKPYKIPVPSNSQDVVLSGQVFEHIPFPWASILEVARVMRTGGVFMMTVPSRGHHHSTYDCWRYYPDSMRALAAQADLTLVRVKTDWPPRQVEAPQRHDFHAIDLADHYWGDTGAVFRKPKWRPSPRRSVNRFFTLQRANAIGDLSHHPRPKGTRLNAPKVGEAAPE